MDHTTNTSDSSRHADTGTLHQSNEPLAGTHSAETGAYGNTHTGAHGNTNAGAYGNASTGLHSQNTTAPYGTDAAVDPNVQGYTSGTGAIPPALDNARFGHGVQNAPGHHAGVATVDSNLAAGIASHNPHGSLGPNRDGALNPTNHTTASNTSLNSQTPVNPHIHTVEPFHHTGAAIPVEATDASTAVSHGHPDKHDAYGTAVPSAYHEGAPRVGPDGAPAKPSMVAALTAKVEIAVGGLLKNPAMKAKGEEKLGEVEAAKLAHAEHREAHGTHGTHGTHDTHSSTNVTGAPRTNVHGGANIEQIGGFAGNVPMTTGAVPGHANAGLF